MKKTLISIVLLTFFCLQSNASDLKDDFERLKNNYKNTLLFEGEEGLIDVLITLPIEEYFSDQMVVELLDRYPIKGTLIEKYITDLDKDGSWSDVDYTSTERSGWKPKIHAERILLLARAYANKNHEHYNSKEIENTIHKALTFWFEAKLVCPNWWYNDIGVPKTLGAAFILFEDKLSDEERVRAIEIMSESKFGMTGQNKVWLAGNVLVKAMLANDIELIRVAQSQIFSEIKIGEGKDEGIKTDWSFHQHGAQQQFGNYGAAFLATTSFWAKVFSNTSFAIEQKELDLLYQLISQGYQRVLWKGYLDVNGLGRQFFKQTQRHKGFSVMFSSKILSGIDNKNRASYNKLINENIFKPQLNAGLTGLYHFWLSDQTVQRNKNWMTSVKMSSKRVIGAEGGNGDNKKGYYLSDGATYTYIDGAEYFDIGAVWDWRKIPGTTVYQTNLPFKELKWLGSNNQSDFVGNVNQANYGMTAMDLNRDNLTAKKTWVFTPDYTFCLGAGISTDSICAVGTTIEQNLLKDQLLYLQSNSWQVVKDSVGSVATQQRYYHNHTGYIIFGGNTTARVKDQTGSWFDVMNTYPNVDNEVETKQVVSIFQDHGMKPKSGTYQYIILPNKTEKEVQRFDEKNINVLKNNADLQIVDLIKDRKLFVAAYAPLDMELKKDIYVKTSDACLLMINYKKKDIEIIVSDPTHKLDSITIDLNVKRVKMDLPTGEYRGTSVVVNL